MAKNVKILLLVNTGTTELPVWSSVGGQRNATLSEEVEEIDVTSEDSDGVNEYEPGFSNATIDCDGLYVPTAAGYQRMKTAFRNKEKFKVRIKEDDQETEEALCFITSRELEGPYDGESTYAMTLRITGKITSVVA